MTSVVLLFAMIGSLLMFGGLITGFMADGRSLGSGYDGWSVHAIVGLSGVIVAAGLHGAVFVYLELSSNRLASVVAERGLPDRLLARGTKYRRRPQLFLMIGPVLLLLVTITGHIPFVNSLVPSYFHLGLASCAVAFNVGGFLVEYSSVAAQSRLLRELGQ